MNLADSAKIVLADTFKFYLKAHFFHWNVEGSTFTQLHELFNMIYDDSWNAVDSIAEQIRTLGSYAPGSFARYTELSSIKDETQIPSANTMLTILLNDNQTVLNNLAVCFDATQEAKNQGLANLIADREAAHNKWKWMLTATLKG